MELRDVAEQLLPSCRARELANMAHGFARLGLRERRLTQLLLPRFRWGLETGAPGAAGADWVDIMGRMRPHP